MTDDRPHFLDRRTDVGSHDLAQPAPVELEDRDPTVCRCGRQWTALDECHCAACHRHFSSISAFDVHQRARTDKDLRVKVTCRDPSTVRKKDGSPRLEEVTTEWGPLWALPGTWQPEGATT
ncbi:MAG: hypothetical protein GEU78_17080 [Actinobacteria bacterium]|nr:hypothetical protein [Actinomycetota bacterium]